jgi:hypothetical protein
MCELPTDKARRQALDKLPPTLFATYDRILMRIEGYSDSVKHLVKKALTLLFTSRPELGLKGICEAISFNEDSNTLEYDEIVNEEDLLQWCSSFVRVKTIPRPQRDLVIVEFAHFTVREYLGTLETHCFDHASAKLKDYAVSLKKNGELFALSCMRCITINNVERLPSTGNIPLVIENLLTQRRSELYSCAVVAWPIHIKRGTDPTSKTWGLVQELFQPCKTTAFCLWVIEYVRRCTNIHLGCEQVPLHLGQLWHETIYAILRPEFSTLHMAAALGLHDICKDLLEMGSDAELCSRFGTPLDCAVGGQDIFKEIGPLYELPHQYVFLSARPQTVQLLIQATVSRKSHIDTIHRSVNIASLAMKDTSPFNQNLEVMMHLIKAGFDVNITTQAMKQLRHEFEFNFQGPLPISGSSAEKELLSNLLEVLNSQETPNATVRFFHQEIQAVVHRTVSRVSLPGLCNTPDEKVLSYIFSLIKLNNAAGMDEFLTSSRCELVKSGGIDPSHPDFSALHLAVTHRSGSVLKYLLDFGLEARTRTRFGRTPVHLCGLMDNSQSLHTLLRYGGTTLDTDKFKKTVWHYAAEKNSLSVLKVLLLSSERETGLKMLSYSRKSPICAAVSQSKLLSVTLLLNYCETHEYWKHKESLRRVLRDPLFHKVCERLFALGIFTNTSYGLCILAESLKQAIEEDDVNHCQKIYTLGCPRELDFDVQPNTPLTLAICRFASSVVEYLLAEGVHVSTVVLHPETLQTCTALELALERPSFNNHLPSLLAKHIVEGGSFSHMESSLLSIPLTKGNSKGLTILLRELKCISQRRNMVK